MQNNHGTTSQEVLESVLNTLETNHYALIETHCKSAETHLVEMQQEPVADSISLYVSLSQKLLGQVNHFMRLRRYGMVPYILELMEKEDEGHDCRSCSSSCTIRHSAQVISIRESHNRLKEGLFRLQSVAKPLYDSDTDQLAGYRTLRAEMMQLDTSLTELFYLEESLLIPKVLEAQEAIHAHR